MSYRVEDFLPYFYLPYFYRIVMCLCHFQSKKVRNAVIAEAGAPTAVLPDFSLSLGKHLKVKIFWMKNGLYFSYLIEPHKKDQEGQKTTQRECCYESNYLLRYKSTDRSPIILYLIELILLYFYYFFRKKTAI